MDNKTKGIAYALTTLILWGFLPVFLKVAVSNISPTNIVWFRFFTAFTILLVWNIFTDSKSLQILRKPPLTLIIAGLCLSINYYGFMQAVNFTSPSNAQLIMQMGPVLFAIAGVVIFKEKIRQNQIIGFCIAIAGFVLFYQQQVSLEASNSASFNTGVAYAIMGFTTWVVYAVLQKKLLLKLSTSSLNLYIFGLGSLVYLPFVNFSEFESLSVLNWVLLILLGLNTLVAYGCLSQALKHTEANKVSIILLLTPIITFLSMGTLALMKVNWIDEENFAVLSMLGALLVLLGAIIVIRKPAKKQAKAE